MSEIKPASEQHWRVGQHYRIHVYDGDRPVATFHREEDAMRATFAFNEMYGEAQDDRADL